MNAEDMTGKRFGKLTAIALAEPTYTIRGIPRRQWLCRCDCGRERVVRADYLKRGQTTYCGFCGRPTDANLHWQKCKCCLYSELEDNKWKCWWGEDTKDTSKCKHFWGLSHNKLTGAKLKEGKCVICGAPTYNITEDTPIYCMEHRKYAEQDNKILDEAPRELLFSLIAGIFLRARNDYLTNADCQHTDAKVFFKSEWAQELSLSGFDAQLVLDQLDEEIEDGVQATTTIYARNKW